MLMQGDKNQDNPKMLKTRRNELGPGLSDACNHTWAVTEWRVQVKLLSLRRVDRVGPAIKLCGRPATVHRTGSRIDN